MAFSFVNAGIPDSSDERPSSLPSTYSGSVEHLSLCINKLACVMDPRLVVDYSYLSGQAAWGGRYRVPLPPPVYIFPRTCVMICFAKFTGGECHSIDRCGVVELFCFVVCPINALRRFSARCGRACPSRTPLAMGRDRLLRCIPQARLLCMNAHAVRSPSPQARMRSTWRQSCPSQRVRCVVVDCAPGAPSYLGAWVGEASAPQRSACAIVRFPSARMTVCTMPLTSKRSNPRPRSHRLHGIATGKERQEDAQA